ncbi:MAG TPA: helix-turn-helix transcriptional regulator [Dehalococcoidia bacterium]|nr:helix-turn-helix transcriptional regulator [Dehalococcoidia bacterium]
MRLPEIGFSIRQARIARGMTQAKLARAAGISRVTLNQLENGTFADLGVRKVDALLKLLGLELTVTQSSARKPDFIGMAATSASVSFREALSEEELIHILLTGKVPANRRAHMRALLEEATPALRRGLAEEAGRWTKPGRVEKNLAAIAKAIGIRTQNG